ncbi:MAG: hypothetical protein ACLU3U_12170 [Gallintestinimicrobium sp.]
MAQDIGKALQELSKAIENNEAVESVVIKITLKKQKSGKASNPKESKVAFIGRERAGNRPSRKPYYNINCPWLSMERAERGVI